MTTLEYILLVLLSLPAHYMDKETSAERTARMTTIARAVDAASARATCSAPYNTNTCSAIWPGQQKELALVLVTKAWWESRLARHIHEGNCREDECDATKYNGIIVHRARSMWQMQRTGLITQREWNNMVGTDFVHTRTAAWAATRILARGRRACHNIYGTLSYYAVNRCDWSRAARRYMFYTRLANKTEEELRAARDRRLAALP